MSQWTHGPLTGLLASRAALQHEYQQVRKRHAHVRSAAKRERLQDTVAALPPRLRFILSQLLRMADFDTECAVAFLRHEAGHKRSLAKSISHPQRMVEDILLATDVDILASDPYPLSAEQARWLRTATTWHKQWSIKGFVEEQARTKGLPTSTAHLLRRLCGPSTALEPRLQDCTQILPGPARVWACRFRSKFRLHLRRVGWRDKLQVTTLVEKAALSSN